MRIYSYCLKEGCLFPNDDSDCYYHITNIDIVKDILKKSTHLFNQYVKSMEEINSYRILSDEAAKNGVFYGTVYEIQDLDSYIQYQKTFPDAGYTFKFSTFLDEFDFNHILENSIAYKYGENPKERNNDMDKERIVDTDKKENNESYVDGTSIKDSGSREEFSTGAVRDADDTKGEEHLLSLGAIVELLKYYYDTYTNNERKEFALSVLDHLDYYKHSTGNLDHMYRIIDDAKKELFNNNTEMMMNEIGVHYRDGAKKYSKRNWEKGMPVSRFVDSMLRHFFKVLAGDTDERHDRAFVWNDMSLIHIAGTMPQFDDYTFLNSGDDVMKDPMSDDEQERINAYEDYEGALNLIPLDVIERCIIKENDNQKNFYSLFFEMINYNRYTDNNEERPFVSYLCETLVEFARLFYGEYNGPIYHMIMDISIYYKNNMDIVARMSNMKISRYVDYMIRSIISFKEEDVQFSNRVADTPDLILRWEEKRREFAAMMFITLSNCITVYYSDLLHSDMNDYFIIPAEIYIKLED